VDIAGACVDDEHKSGYYELVSKTMNSKAQLRDISGLSHEWDHQGGCPNSLLVPGRKDIYVNG
jgi:hypothetical protein